MKAVMEGLKERFGGAVIREFPMGTRLAAWIDYGCAPEHDQILFCRYGGFAIKRNHGRNPMVILFGEDDDCLHLLVLEEEIVFADQKGTPLQRAFPPVLEHYERIVLEKRGNKLFLRKKGINQELMINEANIPQYLAEQLQFF